MKIYTKTGDAGDTGLLGGDRVAKTSLRIETIGDIDELNAAIGVARAARPDSILDEDLAKIQSWLFDLGAEIAAPPGSKFDFASITEKHAEALELSIDRQEESLSPLKNFILPGGSVLAAQLHLARSVCRRAERSLVGLHSESTVRETARIFLNRLSDWLFTAARTANQSEHVQDVPWKRTEDL